MDAQNLTLQFIKTSKSRSIPEESWEELSEALGVTVTRKNASEVYEYLKALEDLNRVDSWIASNGDVSSVTEHNTVLTNTPLASYIKFKSEIEARVNFYRGLLKIPSAKQDYLRANARAANSFSMLKFTVH